MRRGQWRGAAGITLARSARKEIWVLGVSPPAQLVAGLYSDYRYQPLGLSTKNPLKLISVRGWYPVPNLLISTVGAWGRAGNLDIDTPALPHPYTPTSRTHYPRIHAPEYTKRGYVRGCVYVGVYGRGKVYRMALFL